MKVAITNCSILGCGRKHKAKGLCSMHYTRSLKGSDLYAPSPVFKSRESLVKLGINNRHPLYTVWNTMKNRCYNKNTEKWPDYGGRGIVVCQEWHRFSAFFKDMSETWVPGKEINRIDNNGNYEPSNCNWVTQSENSLNRRIPVTNKSGVRGVSYDKANARWQASGAIKGEKVNLYQGKNFDDACTARKEWELKHGLYLSEK